MFINTTRDADIAKLEEDMSKGLLDRKRGQKLIENLYRQSQDVNLEHERLAMMRMQREYEEKYKENPDDGKKKDPVSRIIY